MVLHHIVPLHITYLELWSALLTQLPAGLPGCVMPILSTRMPAVRLYLLFKRLYLLFKRQHQIALQSFITVPLALLYDSADAWASDSCFRLSCSTRLCRLPVLVPACLRVHSSRSALCRWVGTHKAARLCCNGSARCA